VALLPSTKENTMPQIIPKGNPLKKKQIILRGAGRMGNNNKGTHDKIIKSRINLPLPIFFNSAINLMPKNLLAV
jgi:hypothetical protein